eukprot:COSAG06_NODE_4460_length_4239_cov_7.379952_5_plen_147_part_01
MALLRTTVDGMVPAPDGRARIACVVQGEHGDYPKDELGRSLYPQRYFFEQIAGACRTKLVLALFLCVKNDQLPRQAWDMHQKTLGQNKTKKKKKKKKKKKRVAFSAQGCSRRLVEACRSSQTSTSGAKHCHYILYIYLCPCFSHSHS